MQDATTAFALLPGAAGGVLVRSNRGTLFSMMLDGESPVFTILEYVGKEKKIAYATFPLGKARTRTCLTSEIERDPVFPGNTSPRPQVPTRHRAVGVRSQWSRGKRGELERTP